MNRTYFTVDLASMYTKIYCLSFAPYSPKIYINNYDVMDLYDFFGSFVTRSMEINFVFSGCSVNLAGNV